MTSTRPKVFFLPWDRGEHLSKLLAESGAPEVIDRDDLVALKIHFGEKGNDGFIKPDLVRPVIKILNEKKAKGFFTDTGTIYHGLRTNAVSHLKLAAEHGYSQTKLGTPIIIADGLRGDDFVEVEIDGSHFKRVKIATAIRGADVIIALSHFKGHLLSGFGGAIKNLGMGSGSRLGKFEMHSSVSPTVALENCKACGACIARCAHGALKLVDKKIHLDRNLCKGCGECVLYCNFNALSITWSEGGSSVQERFVEYAVGAVKGKRTFYLNYINHVTPNCDCLSKNETPLLPDIGILASRDPVAIDEASLDLVKKSAGDVFAKAHPTIDSTVQLAHAAKLGLGSREYELVAL